MSNEEISCTGCKPENWCRSQVVKCREDRGISTCAECKEYPCDNMRECFEVTKSFEPKCKEVCTDEEYQQLKKAFFEKKWEINLPGVIDKYIFSNDYEQLVVVYKNITNMNELRYNLVYININNNASKDNLYQSIELKGNLKIEAISVYKDVIIYSRKYDLYKLNFLIKEPNSFNTK